MKRLMVGLASSFALLFGASTAHAVCTKPSGSYVGYAAGSAYNSSGQFVDIAAGLYTLRVRSDGVWEASRRVKTARNGVLKDSNTVPAIGTSKNTFNMATCAGEATNSNGNVIWYVVSDSGQQINVVSGIQETAAAAGFVVTYRRN